MRESNCRYAAALLAVVVSTSACAASGPVMVTVPQPGLQPASRLDSIFDYRTAAATVVSILERDLGFDSFPVTFHFYRDRVEFEKALLGGGYDANLARSTAAAMTAIGGHRAVLLNDSRFSSLPWSGRVAMLAHEWGHSLQYELGGGTRGTSDQWLREGFAEWLSVRLLERLDAASMAEVRRTRLRELRATARSNVPSLTQLVTFPQWVEANARGDSATYFLSFLAVDLLLERNGFADVVGYFRRFATSQDRAANFRSAFGEDLKAFETALAARLWKR
jgi:hypothetical protein